MAKVLLRRGREDPPKGALALGEAAFNMETKQLFVGDPASTKGWHHVSNVITNDEGRLYAEVEDRDDLIPLFIKV